MAHLGAKAGLLEFVDEIAELIHGIIYVCEDVSM